MKQLLFLILLYIIPIGVHAEKGQSIMFDKPNPNPVFQQDNNESPNEEQARHCKELSRQMEKLKGKPQRRYAVAERYKAECQSPSR